MVIMDQHFSEFSDPANVFKFDDDVILPNFDFPTIVSNGYKFNDSTDLSFLYPPSPPPEPYLDGGSSSLSSEPSSELDSPNDEFAETVLNFLNQILVEEDMEEKPSMFHDPLALKATEKSLYDALGENYPSSPFQPLVNDFPNAESPNENSFGSSNDYIATSTTSACQSSDPQSLGGAIESKLSSTHPPELHSLGSFDSVNRSINDGSSGSFTTAHLVQNMFSDSESILQFKRGMEEASKFLPPSNLILIDLDKYDLPTDSEDEGHKVVIKVEKAEKEISPKDSRGRKHPHSDDSHIEEERQNKQSAVYAEESQEAELSEMFDKVLLCTDVPNVCREEMPSLGDSSLRQNGHANGRNTFSLNPVASNETVDLRTLLVSCAQSVAADDRRTAYEQLKQIRQYSSPTGDAIQRLANIFAIGLEARLAGTGSELYKAQCSKRISAAEKLKAYQVFLNACPFKKVGMFFSCKMIWGAALSASRLHIVDFGIQYGFQWPIIIKHLSERPGGPPVLRITGIEYPQPGFRPSERLEETGRRLAKYCERFKVPFQYNAIASQNWETIKIDDLKIERDEVLVVNCFLRFKNMLDETVEVSSPRDAVLKLIRRMKPDLFIQSVINGSYSSPFFVTRFREALYHYSTIFDMFDATIDRDSEERMNFEMEFYGREAINVIACEGAERIERPETYKQWQLRCVRAGFKMLPLDQNLLKKFGSKVKAGYHKDFVFDEDGNWMLQGWKGRILYASSCWVPQ